ncbi:MAG: chemotaxis protein CheB [Cyanobacteria bacterium SZAS LIN-5]|nr:chemotaxis protein CheB [Cyanobacteria bacterium SZAS LIN-5]
MSYKLIIIGSSLGGLSATKTLLAGLDDNCVVPIVLVQHREQKAESSMDNLLTNMIQRYTRRRIEEAEDKTPLKFNCIYLAPADYHLLIERECIALSADEPVTYARPSIDVAFDSAARTYGSSVICVVLTGASRDGADGAASVEARGGLVIIQDPLTAEKDTLPRSAVSATKHARVMHLDEIGPFVSNIVREGGASNATRATG